MWCIADLDAAYIANMEDVLALYEKSYTAKEPVVCLDEKPVSLHAEVRPPRPARPGHIAKRDNEYRRCGTGNIFAMVEPKAGRHFTCATPNRSAHEFAGMIELLVAAYPRARTIHLVLDNLAALIRTGPPNGLSSCKAKSTAPSWPRFSTLIRTSSSSSTTASSFWAVR